MDEPSKGGGKVRFNIMVAHGGKKAKFIAYLIDSGLYSGLTSESQLLVASTFSSHFNKGGKQIWRNSVVAITGFLL